MKRFLALVAFVLAAYAFWVFMTGAQAAGYDLDHDGDVDAADIGIVRDCFGQPCGDVDGDQDTDARDIARVRAAFNTIPEGSVEWDAEETIMAMLLNDYRQHPERWKPILDAQGQVVPAPCCAPSPIVVRSTGLSAAAQWMASDTATLHYFGHTDSLGRDFGARVVAFCYEARFHWGGETASLGGGPYQSAANRFESLTNSPGHNGIIIDPKYRSIGIGRDWWGDEWGTRSWYVDWSSGLVCL